MIAVAPPFVREAIGLACDIRDIDPAEVWARLDRHDDQHLICLVVALAALVPADQPVSELLAWTEGAQPVHISDRSEGRADVDVVAVERACGGSTAAVHLSTPERKEVIRELHTLGLDDGQIATRTGLCRRTVLRLRHSLGLPAVYGHRPTGRPQRNPQDCLTDTGRQASVAV